MESKEKKKYSYYALGLGLVFGVKILSFLPTLLSPEFHFLGTSHPFPFKFDSYHYLGLLENAGLSYWLIVLFVSVVLPFLLFSSFFALIYNLTKDEHISFFALLLFAFNPYIFSQTLIGYIDTPPLIMVLLIMGAHALLFLPRWLKVVELIAVASVFWLFWPSGLMILGFVVLCYWVATKVDEEKRVEIYVFLFFAFAIILYSTMKGLLSLKALGVAEYGFLFEPVSLVAFAFTVAFAVKSQDEGSAPQFLLAVALPLIFASVVISRLTPLALIFSVAYMAHQARKHARPKQLMVVAVVVILLGAFIALKNFGPNNRPPADQAYEQILSGLEDKPVYSLWAEGHLIHYFHDGGVVSRAYPQKENIRAMVNGLFLDEDVGTWYFPDDSYVFVMSNFRERLEHWQEEYLEGEASNNSILSRLEAGKELRYYEITEEEGSRGTYWLLRRLE